MWFVHCCWVISEVLNPSSFWLIPKVAFVVLKLRFMHSYKRARVVVKLEIQGRFLKYINNMYTLYSVKLKQSQKEQAPNKSLSWILPAETSDLAVVCL